MPTIRDMGIEAAFQPTPNLINDPSILLSALALRERKRQARTDEDFRERDLVESTRRFDKEAGQRDRALDIDVGDQRLRRREFKQRQGAIDRGIEDRTRLLNQEAAAQGVYADLAEHLGMFPAPEVRARFEQLAPDDQQRAIGMYQEEQTQKQQAAQFQKLGTLLENASANKLIDPTAAQAMLGQAQAAPDQMDDVYGQAQKLISDTAARNADMQQRKMQAETLTQILPTLNIPAGRRAAYSSMLLTDPDASYSSILKMALEEQEQAEADRAAGEQLRLQIRQNAADIMTRHPDALPENAAATARLRAGGVPVDPDSNLTGNTRQDVAEGDKISLDAARKRYEALDDKAKLGMRRRALRDYAQAHQKATGQELPGAHDLDPADDELDAAIRKAKRKLGNGATPEQIEAETERLIYEAK